MPRICEFFGIAIYMYYNDHNPAHFHAEYAGNEALIIVDTLEGSTPFNRGCICERHGR